MVLLQPQSHATKDAFCNASSVQCRSLLLLLVLVGLMFVGLLAQPALLDYLPHWASNATVAVVFTIPYFDVVPRPCVLHLINQPLTAFDKAIADSGDSTKQNTSVVLPTVSQGS